MLQREGEEKFRSDEVLYELIFFFFQVWPALAVIGGVDRGLRIGGKCTYQPCGKTCYILGCIKPGCPVVKVHWQDGSIRFVNVMDFAKYLGTCVYFFFVYLHDILCLICSIKIFSWCGFK